MRNSRTLSLFGLSTLFTVFILLILVMLATLSLKTVINVQNSVERSYQIVEDVYTLENQAETWVAKVNALYTSEGLESLLKHYPQIDYQVPNQTLSIQVTSDLGTIHLSWKLTKTGLILTHRQLQIDHQQDYTQNGDAVYGG